MLKPQAGCGGRKPSNGSSGSVTTSSTATGVNASSRPPVGRNRSVKPPFHGSPVFEGIYNNARMTHFLTAVVGSTCDLRVKNGNVYEGIFKTLSSRCELAVDAVHRRCEENGSPAPPRREEITDTMIFSPADIVTMTCRDVDLNYATRDPFSEVATGPGRLNGEHKEKVLQRWDGGDSNGESLELEADASNGWDANEMFRFNEENYGVKSTYDSSLTLYTVPLERSSSEGYKQREARAARLANEIESSVQYRQRLALENDEGRSEEDKFSAVVRDAAEKERGRDSPGSSNNREGRYIPLPQRVRDMGVAGGSGRGDRDRVERDRSGRVGGAYNPNRSTPPSSSPRPPMSTAGALPSLSAERAGPLGSRAGFNMARSNEGAMLDSHSSSTTPSTHTPPHTHPTVPPTHTPPHTHSHTPPHTLSDASRTVNGVTSRTSPKSGRPLQATRQSRGSAGHNVTPVSRSPKSDGPSHDSCSPAAVHGDTIPVSMAKQKPAGPAPLFPVDVNEILSSTGKDKPIESPSNTEETKSKVPSAQQRSQIEELRKFGKEFRSSPSASCSAPPPAADPPSATSPGTASPAPDPKHNPSPNQTPSPQPEPPAPTSPVKEGPAPVANSQPITDGQPAGTPQPARTPGTEESRAEAAMEGVADQVKKSTLNPNAKEFNPNKAPVTLTKPCTAPTPPRPTPASPSVVLQPPPGPSTIYSPPYLSYVSQIHSVQPPMYQYSMPTMNQGKYTRPPKGSVVPHRPDHSSSAPPMLQAAAAAGPSLVASPYTQSYLQYSPQQYSQQQVLQAMTTYAQPMYPVLSGGARMLGQGGGPAGPQFPGQPDGPQGPQQGLYGPQSFSHHSGSVHPPQPSSTPTGSQPPPQHTTPSPGQTPQSGPQPQSLYHSGPLSAPTPPTLAPGHSSPQASYALQGYGMHPSQAIQHSYAGLSQIAQAHVQGPMSAPHHSGNHGPPQVVMLHAPPPGGPGSAPQHPQHGPQQGPPQHFAYIGHPTAVQVPPHPPFHPAGN
ncbi:ataxin-2-like protein isoform X2 [Brachyhypopomus gauderio]|uniref:ataxin-2-like protein isoform X2 n=1 Tax=Brachyhypopomus gauderio TaxID=698409 RepID=UPI004042E65D